jgi:hypothetical protein
LSRARTVFPVCVSLLLRRVTRARRQRPGTTPISVHTLSIGFHEEIRIIFRRDSRLCKHLKYFMSRQKIRFPKKSKDKSCHPTPQLHIASKVCLICIGHSFEERCLAEKKATTHTSKHPNIQTSAIINNMKTVTTIRSLMAVAFVATAIPQTVLGQVRKLLRCVGAVVHFPCYFSIRYVSYHHFLLCLSFPIGW